jgi:hypothetical protein
MGMRERIAVGRNGTLLRKRPAQKNIAALNIVSRYNGNLTILLKKWLTTELSDLKGRDLEDRIEDFRLAFDHFSSSPFGFIYKRAFSKTL